MPGGLMFKQFENSTHSSGIFTKGILASIMLSFASNTFAKSASEILSATQIKNGLVIHLGCQNIPEILNLNNKGQLSVFGICKSQAEVQAGRLAAAKNNLLGLVNFETLQRKERLPFPSNFAQLIVADLDEIGEAFPQEKEIQRVVAPLGVAYIKKGSWRKTEKPVDPKMDDWRMFYYGPSNNPVSQDELVAPPNSYKWGVERYTRNLRIAHGRVMSLHARNAAQKNKAHLHKRPFLTRNSFSGMLEWEKPVLHASQADDERTSLTVSDQYIHLMKSIAKGVYKPIAMDIKTGAIVKEYEFPLEIGKKKFWQIPSGNKLLQAYKTHIRLIDVKTAQVEWSASTAKNISFVSASDDLKTIFAIESSSDWDAMDRHWLASGNSITKFVDGKKQWTKDLGLNPAGHLIYDQNQLLAFHGDQHTVRQGLGAVSINPDNGNKVWNAKQKITGFFGFSLWKDKIIGTGGKGRFRMIENNNWSDNQSYGKYNMRCAKHASSKNYITFGLGAWRDKDFTTTMRSFGRSGCGGHPYLGYGQIFFETYACKCINGLRGQVSVSPEVSFEPEDDAKRLIQGGLEFNHTSKLDLPNEGFLKDEFMGDLFISLNPYGTSDTLQFNGLSIWSEIHQHQIIATKGDDIVWSFFPGGRVYHAPIAKGDKIYFGSTDGWVYCLNGHSGKLIWKFLAAAAERYVTFNNQLESAWPVYGVVEHQGQIWGTAGRHGEIDWGLFTWGLKPETGAIQSRIRFYHPHKTYKLGEKLHPGMYGNNEHVQIEAGTRGTTINGPMVVVDGKLHIATQRPRRFYATASTGYTYWPKDAPKVRYSQSATVENGRLREVKVKDWNYQVIHANGYFPVSPDQIKHPISIKGKAESDKRLKDPQKLQLAGFNFGTDWIQIKKSGFVTIRVLSPSGRLIRTHFAGYLEAGNHVYKPLKALDHKDLVVLRMEFDGKQKSKVF